MHTPHCRPGSLDALVFEKMAGDVYHAAEYVRPSDTVLDVGANVGAFSLHVHAVCPSARLVCVEPVPDNVVVLRHNVGTFAAIEAAAIAAADGLVTIYDFGLANSGCHSMFDLGYSDSRPISVRGVTLETLMLRHGIATLRFLKLDCQGAEYEVIRTAPYPLLAAIDVIALEVHQVIAAGARRLGAIPDQPALARDMFRALGRTHRLVHGRVDAVDTEQVWVNRTLNE